VRVERNALQLRVFEAFHSLLDNARINECQHNKCECDCEMEENCDEVEWDRVVTKSKDVIRNHS
jgi:hypothetical protein